MLIVAAKDTVTSDVLLAGVVSITTAYFSARQPVIINIAQESMRQRHFNPWACRHDRLTEQRYLSYLGTN